MQKQPPEVFLVKVFWKYAANLQENTNAEVNFIEIILRHECFPVNLMYIFRTSLSKNTSGWLLLIMVFWKRSSTRQIIEEEMRERIKMFLWLLSCSNNSSDSGNSILRCKYFFKYVFLILVFYNKAVKRKYFNFSCFLKTRIFIWIINSYT